MLELRPIWSIGSLAPKRAGLVIAGFGEGNMPRVVRARLGKIARDGVVIVRSSRVDEGLVDREPEDDAERLRRRA